MNAADARKRLQALSEALRGRADWEDPFDGPPAVVERELADWAADAIEAFLADDPPSTLDAAFGVKVRGRPPADDASVAAEILRLQMAGKSWDEIAELVHRDKRNCERILERHEEQAMAAELTDRLNENDKK